MDDDDLRALVTRTDERVGTDRGKKYESLTGDGIRIVRGHGRPVDARTVDVGTVDVGRVDGGAVNVGRVDVGEERWPGTRS